MQKDVILVGDPLRVKVIAEKLDNIHFLKRIEFTHVKEGFNNKEILIISTGIGIK